MRKLLMALAFIVCLICAPAFAGHTNPGGWCECGSSDACICDPGETPMNARISRPNKSAQATPIDLGSETLLVLAALVLVLRYKA